MNLLTYAKILKRKINYYDKVAPQNFGTTHFSNPFAQNGKLTVIWVEPRTCDKKEFRGFF